jgi:hypothetical protein
MADIWTGALISLTGIVVGAGLAELREWLKERKTKRRVAIALTMEVTAMADMVATCASFANFAEFELKDEELNTQTLLAMLPPEPTAYRALAGQLPLLDIETVSAVVTFYGTLELAKRLSTQHGSETTIPSGHVPILGNAWRAATRCALAAMQRVGRYNPPVTHQNDVAKLTELTTELADILSKKWPRIERDDASGKLRIGSASVRGRS